MSLLDSQHACHRLPPLSSINDRIKIAHTVVDALHKSDIIAHRPVPSDPMQAHVFNFKQYGDSVFAAYARSASKRSSLLIKRKTPEATSVEEAASAKNKAARKAAAKKHEKLNVAFKIDDAFDVNERGFEVVLRNLLVSFQAKAGSDATSGKFEVSTKQKRKVN